MNQLDAQVVEIAHKYNTFATPHAQDFFDKVLKPRLDTGRPVFYMAHPVSENVTTGDLGEHNWRPNIQRAKRWLAWLMSNDRSRVFIAPWITEVEMVADNMMITTYDEALRDDEEVVARCDGLILVGGKITNGMNRELKVAQSLGKKIIDWSSFYAPWTIDDKTGYIAMRQLRNESNYGSN